MASVAEINARSTPSNDDDSVNSSTFHSLPWHVITSPADRLDAKSRRPVNGNFRSSKISSVSFPTAPVAPRIATVYPGFFLIMKRLLQRQHANTMIESIGHQQRSGAIGNDTEWVTQTCLSCDAAIAGIGWKSLPRHAERHFG